MSLFTVFLQLATVASLQTPLGVRPDLSPPPVGVPSIDDSTKRSRPRAIEFSKAYDIRLRIHRYGSYTMLPLFATQYVLGSRLLNQREDIADGTRREGVTHSLNRAHLYTALGVGTLFVSNTTTGLWNLYDQRHNTENRGIRTAHVLTMLLADAGFALTGRMGVNAKSGSLADARRHQNVAVASMGIATIGASMMWFFEH
ncbi:MAG: hypothetical protein ABIQ55_11030 [Gemmatimonadaceae bacterium]